MSGWFHNVWTSSQESKRESQCICYLNDLIGIRAVIESTDEYDSNLLIKL